MRTLLLFLALMSLLPTSGCMKLGQDFTRPKTNIDIPEKFQHTEGRIQFKEVDDKWWKDFNDPDLDKLVDEVLKNNLDIQSASAIVLQIRSQFVSTRADRFPRLDFQGQVQRQRKSVEVSVPSFAGGTFQIQNKFQRVTIDNHSLSLPASFEVDLWGRLARAEEAARAELMRAEKNRHIIAQTVVSEAINLYLKMESIERRIQILEDSIDGFSQNVDLLEGRYERGLAGLLDVRQARRVLAQAEPGLPLLRQELGVTQQKLSVLLGRYPKTSPPRHQPENYYNRMMPVPPGLPSDLLLRRPDIRAAEDQLRSLNAKIGVAKASRFPRITLTASFGYSSEELDMLFDSRSKLWSIASGLVQPLFDAGKLKAGQRAAEERYKQGVAEYAKVILMAFSEVEGALLTRKEQLERRKKTLNFLEEARATEKLAEDRYMRGLADYLTVLDAQQTRLKAEENLVLVDLAILTNRVTLHRAIGGGWAKPAPIKMEEDGAFFSAIGW